MNKQEIKKIPSLQRSAFIKPQSINEEEHSIEIVWTTGARTNQFNLMLGNFIEELEVSLDAVNMERINSGNAPFLAMHDMYTLDAILGVVERAWIDEKDGIGLAKVRLAIGDEKVDRIWKLISQGIIRNISVGYTVEEYEEIEEGKETIYRAIKWTPCELSAVTIPADAKAVIRYDHNTNNCIISNHSDFKEKVMNNRSDEKDKKELEKEEQENKETESEFKKNIADSDENEPVENTDTDDDTDNEEDTEENTSLKRNSSFISRRDAIYALCEVAGLSIKQARLFTESKMSVDRVREKILEKRSSDFNHVKNTQGVITNKHNKTLAERAKERFIKR